MIPEVKTSESEYVMSGKKLCGERYLSGIITEIFINCPLFNSPLTFQIN